MACLSPATSPLDIHPALAHIVHKHQPRETLRFRSLCRFGRDERAAVLIYVSIILPVLIGTAVLAVDASRLSILATTLQKGADALALAGAAELDRKPTAIARAEAAIANMVANRHKFAAGSPGTVAKASTRYLKSLPANDISVIDSTHDTTDPALARFVEVTVAPQTLNTILPASFIGGATSVTATARAVAGFDAAVCQFTPLFICNPYEGTGISVWEAVSNPTYRRRQLKLQLGPGGTSQYFPGNYGWLDSPNFGGGSNGANALRDALAMVQPQTCFVQNGVSQKTGNISSADAAINTRFDLWSGPYNNAHNNSAYRPAQNVRKGYVPGHGSHGACNAEATDPNVNKLGRDDSFPYASGRMGSGNWDFDGYWSTNFGSTSKPTDATGVVYSNTNNRPARYDVYRYEIAANLTGLAAQSGAAIGETGTPACYSGGGLSDNPDRRIIYGAIIDCGGVSVHGNSGGPLAVTVFAKFFLTEPVAADGTIHAELVGFVEPGTVSNTVARDIVQLYR
jgi:Flp pilus assembly protein TadG